MRPDRPRGRLPARTRRRDRIKRAEAQRLSAAQRLAAEWWSLALRRFREYVHSGRTSRPDAAEQDADDPDG
jgi:hypothetical protein